MGYYQRHVFFCTNWRDSGKTSCQSYRASDMVALAKDKLKAANRHGPGKTRISSAGCLGRCAKGPIIVVYPEGIWYSYSTKSDVELIVDKHLIQGEIVQELVLQEPTRHEV